MSDLELNKNYKKGDKGKKVRLIQEWLCLHGFNIAIDGDFGPATEYAVREFQTKKGLQSDGIVGQKTFAQLVMPMTEVLQSIEPGGKSLGGMVVAYAEQHLKQHPREVGGQNRGPWVRLYMNGNEGRSWPWCAGFATFVLKQACQALQVALPLKTSFSCDFLAANAKSKGLFLGEKEITDKEQIVPGSFFLTRRTSTDWTHTGLVTKAEEEVVRTIEGNTNDDGDREGYEVCARFRGYKKQDFILLEKP